MKAYAAVKPKRQRAATGKFEFIPAIHFLCEEVCCTDPLILKREPHRAEVVSPHTLDDWWRAWRKEGLRSFLRELPPMPDPQTDERFVELSAAALDYLNEN